MCIIVREKPNENFTEGEICEFRPVYMVKNNLLMIFRISTILLEEQMKMQ